MCMNPVNEELDRAYSNVGLLASDVWNFQEVDDGYKKANLNLWIRFNETEKRLVEDDCDDVLSSVTDEVRTVRDILPYSRLASYNDYPYSEERERMYNENYEPAEYLECSFNPEQEYLEAWMLPEVEEKFKWLTKVSTSRNFTKFDSDRVEGTKVMLDSLDKKEEEQNRASLKHISDTTIFCGENEIPLRGHWATDGRKPFRKGGQFSSVARVQIKLTVGKCTGKTLLIRSSATLDFID
ncbi:hypothetical protein J6590_042988 [Homalodisca vitripennis]|nr:hypothetical protein J6590_042988 [Homalodisca vitripennis]